ncbi:protein-disulfide reductase DsbD family protein [Pseudobdellovibrio exovorus]|uniref:Thiol:disulfide interchange protein n=1 Tax=Pseudobdellovibrio exovorus JSS TaxID=1184267 RepID=M4VAK3_9BACT|nr:cytochrome c biogenesis protein CcdA [Pseudobdellovibrio exovorus]AGH96263.1 thiol:disulfide interchange protein [Pseudobdellovibrio exovorus JSS]
MATLKRILLLILPIAALTLGASDGLAEDLKIISISRLSTWEPSKNQELRLEIQLPDGFHAYVDQFKIRNIQPEGFKAGQISVKPEVVFYDKFSKKDRKGLYEKGVLSLVVEAPEEVGLDPNQTVQFNLRHQICSESVCFLPKDLSVTAHVSAISTPGEALLAPVKESFSLLKSFEEAMQTSLLLSFLSVFIAGILTSFTPCIFPMLPITISILGHNATKGNRFHNFSRALAYVLGIGLTYASLGVAAALTGNLFGAALANKYVLTVLVVLFFAMALSMWGAYELQSPAFIRNRFGTGKSQGIGGALVMGLVAGVVASPCVGPVLVSVLSYVSTTKNVFLGFSLLFTFAMGLGLIFLVIGLSSNALRLLPRSGKWMDRVKFLLGAGMWGAALYYAQFLMSDRWWTALIAASFIAFSIWKGAFKLHNKHYLRRSFLLAVFVFSTTVLLLSFFKPQYLSNTFYLQVDEQPANSLNWIDYSEEALLNAQKEGKPVMIDFFAEWCAACHELDKKTFSTPEFQELAEQFYLVRFDATEDSEAVQQVLRKYDIKGLPTVMFINRNGVLLKELTFTQFLDIGAVQPRMQEALR